MRRSFFTHRVEKTLNGRLQDTLFVYAAGRAPNPQELFSELDEEFKSNLVPIEIVIVVATIYLKQVKAAFEFRKLARLIENNSKVDYFICTFDAEVNLESTCVVSVQDSSVSFEDGADKIRIIFNTVFRQIITELFKKYDVSSQTEQNFHYVKPSGKHTDFFLRASKILGSSNEVSFYSLSLLRLVSKTGFDINSLKCILIDSPVMMSVASLFVDLIKVFNQDISFSPEILSFGSFSGLTSDPKMMKLVSSVPPETLCLISASTSGGLASLLKSRSSLPANQIFHFLYLQSKKEYEANGALLSDAVGDKFDTVCDLSCHSTDNPKGFKLRPLNFAEGACRLCDHTSAIRLVGDHFEPAPPKPEAVTIGKSDAPGGLPSFREKGSRVFAQNVFELGVRKTSESRSRQFFVNTEAALKSPPLLKRLDYFLELNFPSRPEAILSIDPDTIPLAEYIEGKFGPSRIPIRGVSQVDLQSLGSSLRPIVVCAAVIESGRTLLEVSRDLRNAAERAPLIYIIFMMKSHSKNHLDTLKSSLEISSNSAPHKVVIVENILLPLSNQYDSWGDEESFISKNSLDVGCDKDFWKSRLQALSTDGGVFDGNDKIFLENGDANENEIVLQPGFTFFPSTGGVIEKANQTDIFFCISSILQNLRTRKRNNSNNSLRSDLYHQGLLSPENFTRFNDSVLQAGLLRAARPQELNYTNSPDHSREMSRIIQRLILASDRALGASAMEFLLALGTKKISLKKEDYEMTTSIAPSDVPSPRVSRLLEVVKKAELNPDQL